MFKSLIVTALLAISMVKADYNPANLPAKSDPQHGQFGYNDCQKRYGASTPTGHCQNIFINSIKDFCLYAPHKYGPTIGESEARTISYCLKSGYGTRLIPDGTITGAHFLKTPSYVQITGQGDLTKINVLAKDEGGELDPHGATGAGNPVGGLVFTRAFTGDFQQIHEWQNFISYNQFCFRACIGEYAKEWCPHIYDLMGCDWNEPADYRRGSFDQCDGTEGQWPGVYSGSTWYQGVNPTPPAQAPGSSSNCRAVPSLVQGKAIKVPSKRAEAMETRVARRAEWDDAE
ncbi:uncharacterized protein FA14DRAFT_160935 [Meira miltonrushii]|uniref:Carbohydrate-binding module family 13 protein n=1 Tax=Meira miltonrushii TaxID=1280837 RepID=A0A316VEH9_9BASI|nr:uncharacterized protein FA14DRAFT_160935 [Meira miltonrushii]PWN36029.1 hypothetical protein FA14DRAFT_160935 [Meira miltonrushii]